MTFQSSPNDSCSNETTSNDPITQTTLFVFCLRDVWYRLMLEVILTLFPLLGLWMLRRLIQGPFYRKNNRIDGKVVIVTSCNAGIGKETVLELARRGAKIYMACRDPIRCEETRIEIMDRTHNQQLFNRTLDLGSLKSVRSFVARFKKEESNLDLLINNAGVMDSSWRSLNEEGFEQQLCVNHLGHFLLTNLLLDHLKRAAPSRIVVGSSSAQIFGRSYNEDLMGHRMHSKLLGVSSQSKVANVLFTRKLSMLLMGTGVTVNCCHPGLVRTKFNGLFIAPNWLINIISILSVYFVKSPRASAQTQLFLALDPALADSTGGVYVNSFRCLLVPWARDMKTADWLWRECEKLVAMPPPRRRK